MIVAGPWPDYGPHFPGGRIDPGNVRWNRVQLASPANYTPLCGAWPPGPTPLPYYFLAAASVPMTRRRDCPGAHAPETARPYSERCCGIPASRARTSVSLYRR
jgi:hypothetical protein